MAIKTRPYQVCTNCAMDTTDSGIVFDEQGRCDYCTNFYSNIQPHWHTGERGQREIAAVVEKIKQESRNDSHDCLIGLSGGVDSSYVAYLAKEKFGLRPLLYHVDAGWNSQEAVANIEKLVDGLGLDLYTEVVDWPEMRDLQLAFFRAQVPHLDTPQDHAFFAGLYNFAARNNVKYIITGANYSTECVREPLEWHYHASDLRQLKDIHRRFGTVPLRKFPLAGIFRYRVFYRFVKGIRVVKPLDYVPYVKQAAIDELVARFDWQRYSHKHYESRFTRFYEGFWLPTKFGYDKRRAHFSSLILTGQMSREEALRQLAQPAYDPETVAQDFEYVATKLGVTVRELTDLLNGPKKSYRDYDNDMPLIEVGTTVLRLLGVQRALIRSPTVAKQTPQLLAIGPMPPPITGMALVFEAVVAALRRKYDVEIVNLSKITRDGIFGRFVRSAQALVIVGDVLLKSGRADAIYFKISQTALGNFKDLAIYVATYRKLSKMTVHLAGGANMRVLLRPSQRITRAVNRFFLSRVNKVVVLGPAHVDIFSDLIDEKKIAIVANYADDALFITEESIREKFSSVRPLRLLFLSNLIQGKGHLELLEGFMALSPERRNACQLDFAGDFDSAREKSNFLSSIKGLPNVRYHGVVVGENRRKLYQQAHVFCLPTYYANEGQPLAILEAYAAGCVVLTTNHSGIVDVFSPEQNGFQVEKRSAASIQHALETALDQPDGLVHVALANRRTADGYTLQQFEQRLLTVIEETLN